MNEDLIRLIKSVLEELCLKQVCKFIDKCLQNPNKKYVLSETVTAEIEDYLQNKKNRYFEFGEDFILQKYFIASASKEWSMNNEPCIVINKLNDDSGNYKDNPIKNLYIAYDSVELRDEKYNELIKVLTK